MIIELSVTKELFHNYENGYRILACSPTTYPLPEGLELNAYGNFSLVGNNLDYLALNTPISLDIEPSAKSNRPATYVLKGYPMIQTNGERIKVKQEDEYKMLCHIMSEGQARNVVAGEPDFIEKILNGEENNIDINKIYNVGKYRLKDYCTKIRTEFRSFLLMPVLSEYGVDDFDIAKSLAEENITAEILKTTLELTPYTLLIEKGGLSFREVDKKLMTAKRDAVESSYDRAKQCILWYLSQVELEGDTRINANALKDILLEDYPAIRQHIKTVVKDSREIYYDDESKYCSLSATYEAEKKIAEAIKYRVAHPIDYGMRWEDFKTIEGFNLTEEQSNILRVVNEKSVGLLVGYAGSGKSATTKAIIKMLEANGRSYRLLAPTGIAAKRLREATGRPASTIHMALARGDLENPVDYILIDEFSMLSVHLLASVVEIIPDYTKLIFVCDNAQLASISCGNVLQDIIDSGIVPTVQLTKVFRYGEGGIATVATDTRNGTIRSRKQPFDDYSFYDLETNAVEQVVDLYGDLLREGYKPNDILVLCPYNTSDIGSYVINDAIQKAYNHHSDTVATVKLYGEKVPNIMFKVGDKVINKKNDYHCSMLELDDNGDYVVTGETAIMNGDIGIVRDVKIEDGQLHLDIQFDEAICRFSANQMGNLLLGYCISVHKSQGSQAKVVVLITAKRHERMLSRNLLYVGVSRAQERLIEIGDAEAIKNGLEREEQFERDTWLKEMLIDGNC